MHTKSHFIGLLGGILLAAPLAGQQARPLSAHLAAFVGTEDQKKATHSTSGFGLGFAWEGVIPVSAVPFRLGLGYNYLPGKEEMGLKTSLGAVQFTLDTFVSTPIQGLRMVIGLSLNNYHVQNSGTPPLNTVGNPVAYWSIDESKGLKAGGRLGAEWRFSDRFSAELLCQVTELGTTPRVLQETANQALALGPVNPSWLQVGIRYHF